MVFHKITIKKKSHFDFAYKSIPLVEIFKFVLLTLYFFKINFKHWEIKQLFDKHLTFIELDL
jgi:hypothetical protein